MNLEPLQTSIIRINTSELYIFAKIVSSVSTEKARIARHARLHGNSITLLEISHALPSGDNDSSCFMAKNTIAIDSENAYATSLPEMYI